MAQPKDRILIFDDDPDILEVCSIILSTEGFTVSTETSCENLLEKVAAAAPAVILMDNKIPKLGGVMATQTLKADSAFATIPVVFFSANRNVKELSQNAGADFFIEKPFDMDHLTSTIRKAMGQQ